jgi:hypothetical protein
MTILESARIAKQASVELDIRNRANEFLKLARLKVGFAHRPDQLLQSPEFARATDRVKAAIAPGTTTGTTNAAPLVAVTQMAEAFASVLVGSGSVLDTLLANGAMRVPFNVRVVSVTTGFTGHGLGELSQKRFSALSLTAGSLTPIKCVAQTLLSQELAKFSDPGAVELFNRDLSLAVVREVMANS